MDSPQGLLSRARWVIVFGVVLLAVSAVPVLAASPPLQPPPDQPQELSEQDEQAPDATDVARALGKAAGLEAEERELLDTPRAEEEREESADAFASLSSAEASALLRAQFAEQLRMIDQDPARVLTDVGLVRVLGPTDAQISVGGETVLMDGAEPVRVPNEEGDLEKVSLDLDAVAGGYVPSNPITDLELPARASDPMTIGGDLTVSPVGAVAASEALPFGEKDLFYPEAQTDTDLLAMPISGGLELFSQLRSADSPQELRFRLSLPDGAVLWADGEGGAEVLQEGERTASVRAPRAVDAQGAEVPVSMEVEDDQLVLTVEHRESDFAYPILVDPTIQEDWYNGANSWWAGGNLDVLWPTIWPYQATSTRFQGQSTPIYATFGGSNRGLFVNAASTSGSQPANQNGQFTYTAPGSSTYITAALINPFWRDDHGCGISSYPEPHDYSGLWSPTWGWADFQRDQARVYGYGINIPPTTGENAWRAYTGHILVIGLGTGEGGGAKIPCARDVYAGGVTLWMDDWEAPTLNPPTGMPTGWVGGNTPFTISAGASDAGLGVYRVTISPEGTALIQDQVGGCTGLATKPCPASRSSQFSLTGASFDEGVKKARISAEDPTRKGSATYEWTMKVDLTPPEVALSGQLAQATDEDEGDAQDPEKWDELSLPTYNLKIESADGSQSSPTQERSGVRSIEVFLDGNTAPEKGWTQSCASSCPMTQTFQLKLLGLAAGKHTLKVVAKDQLGHPRERNIEFEYIPATGIKDEYVLHHFPLPNGQGDEAAEEQPVRPELAVNVMNGNLVYRERDIEVPGPAVDLEVERYYNSHLPSAENTEWGDGWTLAQTPDLEPIDTGGSPAPDEAELLDASGAIEGGVELPSELGGEQFDPGLQATLTKDADGYELTDQTGETNGALVFDEAGETTELQASDYAEVEYSYEAGKLTEIAVDDPGSTELRPDEVQVPSGGPPSYVSAIGSVGSGDGQMKGPADVVRDASGNLWVADRLNNRIERFGLGGEFLSKFGSAGAGNGQFSSPSSLAIDSKGNLWVADKGNGRVQKFNPAGEYLGQFGSKGTGNGQFASGGPEGIAIDSKDNIWVSDTYAGRIQKFNEKGEFVKVVGSKGTGSGQLGEPTGIDVASDGNVWVTDWQNNRVAVFSESGNFVRQFGSAGTGNGQFARPDAIDVDAQGRVWVGDQNNGRVQQFDQSGNYVGQFGSKGSGPGQFSFAYPMGLFADSTGSIWVTDSNNNRIQRWRLPGSEPVLVDDDPRVDVELSSGLVSGVEGEAAGSHSYSHNGDDLTAHDGPDGESKYSYDAEGRMTKVELANGTTASIAYKADGRVSAVTVNPAGPDPAATTFFSYSDEPRRTTVIPQSDPAVTYEIGADGSVLRWWNAKVPPVLDSLSGSLYANRETSAPITTGDHNLIAQAHSEEGIASIEVIANGNQLVSEKTCEQDPETPAVDCVTVVDEWVTNTGNWPPGIVYVEVVATDRIGQAISTRFWVNIPYTPPPDPDALEAPRFSDVLKFRQAFGLDIDLHGDELAINDRVFDLIGDWHNPQTPEGENARGTMERWGVPLRQIDVAELNYREWYLEENARRLPAWAAAHANSTYAGYSVDNPAGGKIRVGFTADQAANLAALRQSGALAAPDRVELSLSTPAFSLSTLVGKARVIAEAPQSSTILESRVDSAQAQIDVGAASVAAAESWINGRFGSTAGFVVHEDLSWRGSSRWSRDGPLFDGQAFGMRGFDEIGEFFDWCTVGLGAAERSGVSPSGTPVVRNFVLTAGHCFEKGTVVGRWNRVSKHGEPVVRDEAKPKAIGAVKRRSSEITVDRFATDAEAIRLTDVLQPPRTILLNPGQEPLHVTGTAPPTPGVPICSSGAKTEGVRHGEIVETARLSIVKRQIGPAEYEYWPPVYEPLARMRSEDGDSGGPVWQCGTGRVIGLISANSDRADLTGITPLLKPEPPENPYPPFSPTQAPGILNAPEISGLHLTVAK